MDIFTRAQWRVAGRNHKSLTNALQQGAVRRLVRGAYAWSDVPDTPQTRARAISLVRPRDTVVGRTTSAWLSDVDVLPPGRTMADQPIHLIVATDVAVPRLRGCVATQAALPASDVVEEHGVVRTSDLRTALDLGRFAPWQQAVAALDAFLNRERATTTPTRTARRTSAAGSGSPPVLDQIVRAADYEARTGNRWEWMPLDRLLAA